MEDEVEFEKVEGEIGLFTVKSFREEIYNEIKERMDKEEEDGCVNYIFDFQNLKYVNSHFIGLLAKRNYDLSKKGGRIDVLNAQEVLKKIFEIFGLLDKFEFHTDLQDAIDSFDD